MVHLLGGVTFEEAVGIEQHFVSKLDEQREKNEATHAHLEALERLVLDIRDRRVLTQSIPEEDWNLPSMRHEMAVLSSQLAAVEAKAEQRRRRASEVAKQRARDGYGRFLPG